MQGKEAVAWVTRDLIRAGQLLRIELVRSRDYGFGNSVHCASLVIFKPALSHLSPIRERFSLDEGWTKQPKLSSPVQPDHTPLSSGRVTSSALLSWAVVP